MLFKNVNLRANWQQKFQSWVNRRIPPSRQIVLNLHNIFIIPNKQGLGFCFVLALMFIGAVNYELSLAFSLVFLLVSMFILTIFYTYRNLAGLHLSGISGQAIFAGESAKMTIILSRYGKRIYESIFLSFKESRKIVTDLISQKEDRVNLYVPTNKRGWFSPGRLTVETFFPFGICRAWSLVDLDIRYLVYPTPIACDLELLSANQQNSGNTNMTRGNDDFYQLREYQRGDSLKHVAWKNFARGQGMFTKEYSSNVDDKIWLKWDMFSNMGMEDRLSRLCYCVITLDASGIDYGLDLPDEKIRPAKGSEHYHKVLKSLALFDLDEADNIKGSLYE